MIVELHEIYNDDYNNTAIPDRIVLSDIINQLALLYCKIHLSRFLNSSSLIQIDAIKRSNLPTFGVP